MNHIRQLFVLQEIDLEIDARSSRITALEARLGESEALLQARAAVQAQRDLLANLEKRQRELEWAVDDISSKLNPEEKKLYSGSVRNIKELTALQEEVDSLQRRKRGLEDQIIDIMSSMEQVQQEMERSQQALDWVEAAWQAEQEEALEEKTRHEGELAILYQRRERLAREIPPSLRELYENIRASRGGLAVAKVERGMCQGCRITLPMSELQRARTGESVVQCNSCTRLLYVS